MRYSDEFTMPETGFADMLINKTDNGDNWSDWEICPTCHYEGEMDALASEGKACPQCKNSEDFKNPLFNPDGTLMVSE